MGGGVDKPCDMVDPGNAQGAPPHDGREAPNSVQRRKHDHHVPCVRLLDEPVEGLRL